MSEVIRDSAIKLFGQTIALHLPLPPADKLVVSDVSLSEQRHTSFATSTSQDSKDESGEDSTESMNHSSEKSTSSDISDDPNSAKKDDCEEKTRPKKPDKIIPCPRCNSMDTKFCYYNNYNVNQPRHFCKKCQRYWTSGGTMRNVAVGSGRRKNKNALLPSYPLPDPLRASDANPVFLISPPGFPVSFYPATLYWGSAPNMPPAADPPPQNTSSILGKHSRIGKENVNVDGAERRSVLRIHDPRLGMKKDKVESKGDRRSRVDHRAMVLQANPAALSRSLNFHETV